MRIDPINVFGHLTPATHTLLQAAQNVLQSWLLEAELSLEGDLLRLDFEGVVFPEDDFRKALLPHLLPTSCGKIDIIDREAWTLTRLVFSNGACNTFVVGLNHVLDHSGH